jgi:hypothetical protein
MVADRQIPAVKRVRATLKKRLVGQFAEFTRYASIADLYFMGEVLSSHENDSLSLVNSVPELQLPAAFDEQIGRGVPCFVPVPDSLMEAAELYIGALTAETRPRRKRS